MLKETTISLSPSHWIALIGVSGGLVAFLISIQVKIANIETTVMTEKEKLTTYVQQNYNDHRGMYVDFKGEVQQLNNKMDENGKKIDNLKDMIIQSSRGIRLPVR